MAMAQLLSTCLAKHETLGPILTTMCGGRGRKTIFTHQASRAKPKYLTRLIHIFRSWDSTSAIFPFLIFILNTVFTFESLPARSMGRRLFIAS